MDTEKLKDEIEIYYYKSRGPGGQRKNKRETAVKIRHIPSGITVIATEHRSQARNRELAFERLVTRLEKLREKPKPRIPIKPSLADKKRRLEEKKKQSKKKEERRIEI